MPPRSNTHSTETEGRIALEIEALKQGYFTSFRSAAKAYDVPRSTLQTRVKKTPARRDSKPTNRKLTDTEESTLV